MQAFVSRFGIFEHRGVALARVKEIHTAEHEKLRRLLREARSQAGLTQSELANRLDVPQSFVSKYESGERRLDILELRLVCRGFGISMSEFVRRLEKEIG
jgi:ribosome-binding protein aMBF1 (putative translation factor)